MTGARGARAATVALVLAVPVLAGCDAAQQAQEVGQGSTRRPTAPAWSGS